MYHIDQQSMILISIKPTSPALLLPTHKLNLKNSLISAKWGKKRSGSQASRKLILNSIAHIASTVKILPEPWDSLIRELCVLGGGNGGNLGFRKGFGGGDGKGRNRKKGKLGFLVVLLISSSLALWVVLEKEIENGPVTTSLKTSLVNAYHPALNVSNIRSLVPLVLDGETVQFTPWATLFRNTAKVYAVLDHIDSTVSRPLDVEDGLWERLDAVVLQWIYGTIHTDLLYRILDETATAMVVWEKLRDLFQDNKGTRVVHLENQFGMIKLENCSSLADYCQRLKSISDQLSAMGHSISEERLVLQLAGKLTSDYAMVATLIQQASPLPSFSKACSMLELDRVSREKNQEDSSLTSSSTALVATTPSSGGSSGGSVGAGGRSTVMGHFKGSKKKKQSFSKGGNKLGGHQAQPQQPLFYPPWVGPWSSFYPPCPFPSAPVPWRGGQGQQPSVSHGQQGVLGRAPQQGNPNAAFLAPGHNFQPTDLPAMFNTMQLQPPDNNWYMDTGATSHLMNGSGSPDGEFVDTVQ